MAEQAWPETTAVLYVVATPIGNLDDISRRALETLAAVDLIAAEDTRHSGRLLAHYGITTRLWAVHEHNETRQIPRLLARLAAGEQVALISDAGTPLISDPGYPLVRAARAAGYRVVPIPGPNAALCALSAAGLPSDRFLFLGFPPRTRARRLEWLAGLAEEPGTLIFHESGHRLPDTLQDLGEILGATRRALLARELTKRFETFLEATLEHLAAILEAQPEQRKGEMVLLVEGDRGAPGAAAEEARAWRTLCILARELPLSQAAALAAEITGIPKNRLYKRALDEGLDREASA